jgi:hypothetical protein
VSQSDHPGPSATAPSGELAPAVISPLPARHEGPEHTLVYLAIEIKSTKKETALIEGQITNITTEIGHREARVNTLQSVVTSLEGSIPSDYVPVTALEKLQEQMDERSRELDGWIAREAARKGKLIQLRSQVHAKAKLQAQWHRSRSAMPDHWSLEAEQMLRESVARASAYVAAACRERPNAPVPLPRDTTSKTRIQLNRSRSPYAPVKKPPSRNSSQKSRDVVTSSAKRAARITGPPPSSFRSDSGLQNEIPLGDDVKAMFNPKRRTRPVSVVVPEQNREEMNARLADFYAPRPKSPTAPAVIKKKAQSTPPSTLVFDDIPNSVFGDIDIKLDLDLKLPTSVQHSSSTPPSSYPASPAAPKFHTSNHRPAAPSPLARRLSKRANRHSTSPIPTAPPVLAPLSLPPSEPIGIPPPKRSPPIKASINRHSPLRSSFQPAPQGSNTPAARLPQAPLALTPTPQSDKIPIASDVSVPEWLNELLTPLQNPRPSPSSGNFAELVLDLRIPSFAPNSTTPPAEREEWDIVNTSPFADRDSFQITTQKSSAVNNASPSTTPNTNEDAQNPRIAKLRNRASYILPRPRSGSSRPMGHITKSEDELNSRHSVAPNSAPSAAAGVNRNETRGSAGGKWRKRLSLAAVLPHRS